jgi:hypothetical protein
MIRRSGREERRRDERPALVAMFARHAANVASVARMKRSEIRGGGTAFPAAPHSASLRAGYQGDFIVVAPRKQAGSGVLDEQRPNRECRRQSAPEGARLR